jgi:hypothetical protein
MNDELERSWKEAVLVFKALILHLSLGAEEAHENLSQNSHPSGENRAWYLLNTKQAWLSLNFDFYV